MLTKLLWLIPLLGGGAMFLTGAWNGSLSSSPGASRSLFVAQPLALEAHFGAGEVGAAQVLDKAIEILTPERVTWLKTKVRQTMTDAQASYVAEGYLQRGPNHCARLDMQVLTSGLASHLLVVSDGELLAQEISIPGVPTKVVSGPLPASAPTADALAKERHLAARGCGGPGSLLQNLQPCLKNLKLQTGLLQGQPVILLKGDVDTQEIRRVARTETPIGYCFLFLDAKTIWPRRVEWWGTDRVRGLRCVLQMDFDEPELNKPLSLEQCTHDFSYQPKQVEPN